MGREQILNITKRKTFILSCIIIVTAFITLLFFLLVLDILITNQILYLVIIPYFFISSIFSYILHMILENKSIQKQQESDERYKTLVENHPDGIIIHDQGTILYANPAIYQLLGYELGSAIGLSILDFTNPTKHEMIRSRQKEAYAQKSDILFEMIEIELIHKDGTPIFVESKAIICQYNHRRCVQLVIRDISERKNSEELLRVSDKLAVVGQLAAGIAHEIRNPLTSIKGFVQVMRESKSSSTQYYDVILTEIDRINQVTSDFLILAKPQAKNLKQSNLLNILTDITNLLHPEALLHNVQLQLHDENREILLLCDTNELKQAFINIIKNSMEAMPLGGKVDISTFKTDSEIRLTIQDTGSGIPKELLPNIGQPFYTLKERGTGLGLVTTIRIIESHGGTLNIHSEEGIGTTVTILFPQR